jgi:hypothetical protein
MGFTMRRVWARRKYPRPLLLKSREDEDENEEEDDLSPLPLNDRKPTVCEGGKTFGHQWA